MTRDAQPSARPSVSAVPIAVSTVSFCLLTFLLLTPYSLVHWKIASQRGALYNVALDLSKHTADGSHPLQGHVDQLRGLVESLGESHSTVLAYLEVYHVTGLMAFLFSVFSFRARPRWLALVSLPFGLAGLFGAFVIM